MCSMGWGSRLRLTVPQPLLQGPGHRAEMGSSCPPDRGPLQPGLDLELGPLDQLASGRAWASQDSPDGWNVSSGLAKSHSSP